MYSFLLVLIYTAFVSLGLPDSLLGAGWPVIHGELHVPMSYMGIVSMVISCGTIVSSLLSDTVTKKTGTGVVTVTSVFLTATALLGFSFAKRFWQLIILAIPYGLGAGAIDAALNNYVAVHYTSKHMSWLHCFWGVGAIISPFIMSHALTVANWHSGYFFVGVIQIGIGILLLCTLPVWKANKKTFTTSTQQKSLRLSDVLKIRGVTCIMLGFFAYCAAEATAMNWASSYLVEARGVGHETAAAFASLFYIGITVGRFFGGFITDKLGDRKMILTGTCILICGIALLMIPVRTNTLSLMGFVIIGLGCAPIYPCIIHSTPRNFGAENSGAIIGIQMASAYVGVTFIPPLFGFLSKKAGFDILPVYLLIFFILMVVLVERTFRLTATERGTLK
ncbi:MAG: MFS transporter [Clostridia bacterium]|nr:MFS transporter [Clostridia bacterium]